MIEVNSRVALHHITNYEHGKTAKKKVKKKTENIYDRITGETIAHPSIYKLRTVLRISFSYTMIIVRLGEADMKLRLVKYLDFKFI